MLKIEGEIVEVGKLENAHQEADIGIVLKTEEGAFITVSGISVGEIWKLGKAIYQRASITIEVSNVQIEARPAFGASLSNAGLDTGKEDAL